MLFSILFCYLLFGIISSAFSEENFLNWLIINYSIAILAGFVNYIIWRFYKHSKRYFSLQYFVVVIVLTFYLMSPAFEFLYLSKYFWFLLAITIGIMILLVVNRVSVARAIYYPQSWAIKISIIYCVVLVCLFIIAPNRRDLEGSVPGVRAILYLLGFGLLSISPALLISREKTKELENMPDEGIKLGEK